MIYTGFYHVPGLKSTLISLNGIVIDINKNWCPLITINLDGYPCVNSENDRRFIHRLLALTFLPKPTVSIDNLDVNHIDGIKSNNSINNLEWATRSENCLHAYRTGLRDDNVSVLSKDLRDGSVISHYSIHECSRYFNVDPTLIYHHLKPFNYGKISFQYYLLIREDQEWPSTEYSEINNHRNGTCKNIAILNLDNNKLVIFKSIGLAAKALNINQNALYMHMFRNGVKPYLGYMFLKLIGSYIDKDNEFEEGQCISNNACKSIELLETP